LRASPMRRLGGVGNRLFKSAPAQSVQDLESSPVRAEPIQHALRPTTISSNVRTPLPVPHKHRRRNAPTRFG
jgi:hypothetical protein